MTTAQENHGQSLERLAERGGLDPVELWLLVHDRPLFEKGRQVIVAKETAIAWLRSLTTEVR